MHFYNQALTNNNPTGHYENENENENNGNGTTNNGANSRFGIGTGESQSQRLNSRKYFILLTQILKFRL